MIITDDSRLYTDSRFDDIYNLFAEKYSIKVHELFSIATAVGYKRNKREAFNTKGKEFRFMLLSENNKALMHMIILKELLERVDDSNFEQTFKKYVQEYANGGMEILIDEVFRQNFRNGLLEKDYNEYDVDLLTFIKREINELPF